MPRSNDAPYDLPRRPNVDPELSKSHYAGSKRKARDSRSPSPLRQRRSPQMRHRTLSPIDHVTGLKSKEQARAKPTDDSIKQAAAKVEYERLLNMRSGGTYIPPAKLRALQAQITDKKSKEYQRMAWEALKKSINGLINKVNVSNIKHIVPELFGENLVRGRGLFCRSIMKAQAASLPFTPIYAATAAVVNTKLPQVGELLIGRLITQFKKAFRRNDKSVCLSSTTFLAHLANQQVVHEMLIAQMLLLLLHKPTDDSVEIAVGLTREVGQHLEEMSGPIALAVFDQFRNILHEQDLDKRVQYMIEVLFQIRKDRYQNNPSVKEELDLIEEEDQITHRIELDDEVEVQDGLNVFKYDDQWEEKEKAYQHLKAEILGEESGSDAMDGSDSESSSEDEESETKTMEIKDQTNADLVQLRKKIFLTIMSSVDYEEACHKLMKLDLPVGREHELPSMIIECCSQEKTYLKFYGLIGERFAKLNRLWTQLFEESFVKYYDTIHRYETNRLRNIARFFGHMFSTNAIGWYALSAIHLNEEETTSSSRIFIKILFQEIAEATGIPKLAARLREDELQSSLQGLFPTSDARNIRFSINYFTSIGLGLLTEDMRDNLARSSKPANIAVTDGRDNKDDEAEDGSISSYSTKSRDSRFSQQSRSHTFRNRADGRGRSSSRSPSYSPRKERRRRSFSSQSYSTYSSRSRSHSPSEVHRAGDDDFNPNRGAHQHSLLPQDRHSRRQRSRSRSPRRNHDLSSPLPREHDRQRERGLLRQERRRDSFSTRS